MIDTDNENMNDGKPAITNNKLYITIKAYLEERNISKLKHLFVSLSGGVDSMVIIKILHYLRLFDEDKLILIMISSQFISIMETVLNRIKKHYF